MQKTMTTLPIEQIKPYENNPRINDDAVEAVRKSMEQCGYIAPIVVDENHVVLAGHTRLKALKEMGAKECEAPERRQMPCGYSRTPWYEVWQIQSHDC